MSTIAQIDANRRNAQHSTGPKTPEGKAASKRNATKHGLLANEAVLAVESMPEFEQLLSAFLDEYHPASPTEEFFVRQMADAQWRLRRHTRIETGVWNGLLKHGMENHHPDINVNLSDPDPTPEEEAISTHDHVTGWLGHGFLDRAGSVAILQRYENNIRRSFYRALDELRRLRTHPIPQPPPPADSDQTNPIDPTPDGGPASQAADSTLVSSLESPSPKGASIIAHSVRDCEKIGPRSGKTGRTAYPTSHGSSTCAASRVGSLACP